jgi:nucleotide-binding universal stress UspA family protein
MAFRSFARHGIMVLAVVAGLPAGEAVPEVQPAQSGSTPVAAPAIEVLPVPDEAAQAEATRRLREIYKAEFASRKAEDQRLLARSLLDQASRPGEGAARFVMLSEAMHAAAKAADVATLLQAARLRDRMFGVEADDELYKDLAVAVQAATTSEQAGAIVGELCRLAETASERDAYANAQKAVALAEQMARRSKDAGLVAQVRTLADRIKPLAEAWRQISDDADLLGEISPAGHTARGRFYCLVKGDWAAGLPHLVAGDDEILRRTAEAELAAQTAEAFIAVADQWYDQAAKQRAAAKEQMLIHAAQLYRLHLAALGGLERARIDKRLVELGKALGSSGRMAGLRIPAGALLYLGFERGGTLGQAGKLTALDSSGCGHHAQVTGLRLAAGPHGQALECPPEGGMADCGNPPTLRLDASLTIAMWLWPGEFGQRRNPLFKSYGSELAITQETTGILSFYYRANGRDMDPYQGFTSGAALPLRTWTHVALVRQLEGPPRLIWYLNGKRQNEVAAAYPASRVSAQPLVIGRGYTGFPYIGQLDELGIWQRALSDAEVKQVYEGAAAGR